MPKFKVRVTRMYRVQADITIEVEAEDQQAARDVVDWGCVEPPENLSEWQKEWELVSEEVRAG